MYQVVKTQILLLWHPISSSSHKLREGHKNIFFPVSKHLQLREFLGKNVIPV